MWSWLGSVVGGAMLQIAGNFALRMATALGIGVATYAGLSTTLDWLKSNVVVSLQALPPEIVGMLALMKVGSCVSMYFSALVIRMTLGGMTSGTVRTFIKA
jgi:hypothetical protein